MERRLLQLTKNAKSTPLVKMNGEMDKDFSIDDLFKTHEDFIHFKALEGLAPRTLKDHKNHMSIFKKYFYDEKRSITDRFLSSDVLRSYIYHMVNKKNLKPCTINIRLRTLKCYIKWLYSEGYIDYDYSVKLKLLKVPQDTIKPLSDIDVRKMLNAPDKDTYTGYRDFCLMLLMLDCGIRVGEALNLKIADIDSKSNLITISAENEKTRAARYVPISTKTTRLLQELIQIAQSNKCEFLFLSAYGGKIDKYALTKKFEQYGKKIGITTRCTPHVFRHTFAVNFIKGSANGIPGDVFTLQKILGHTTLTMVRKYVQLETSDLIKKHKQVGLVDKYLK